MIRIGYVLLAFGFVAATFVASLDPLLVNWAWFGPTIGVAAVGVVLIRRGRHRAASAGDRLANDRALLDESLQRVGSELAAIGARAEGMTLATLRVEIDQRLREPLRRFAEARESMIHLYGLSAYADVMGAFAAAERYVNRVWSAATDGYRDEALTYLERAGNQIAHAQERLQAAKGAAA